MEAGRPVSSNRRFFHQRPDTKVHLGSDFLETSRNQTGIVSATEIEQGNSRQNTEKAQFVSTEKAEAIIIRQADFSESSRVITFFSKEFGKFAALAKGAKRLKGPFDAALDLLSTCRIVFLRKSTGSLDLLTQASLVRKFTPASGNLQALYVGYYVAELLCLLTEDYDPDPRIFDLTVHALETLSSADVDTLFVVVRFESRLLTLVGIMPNLDECSVCGDPVKAGQKFAHWVSQGGLLCENCRQQEYAGRSVTSGAIAVLRQLTKSDSDLTQRVRPTREQITECHQLAVSVMVNLIGRKPSTLRYLPF